MSETKTVEQWLQELPEPYRGQALENAKSSLGAQSVSLRDTIHGSFIWEHTPQGHGYWEEVFTSLSVEDATTTNKGILQDIKEATPHNGESSLPEGMLDAIFGADPPSPWIKASDELPFAQEPVLTFKKGDGSWVQWVDEYGSWMNGTDPTHWMPLPEPPKED